MVLSPPPLVIQRRVEFAQTDAAGILHFSTYYLYMESAEAELFRQLGFPLLWSDKDTSSGFPRVDSQCSFLRPLVFGELVRIELSIAEISPSTIHFNFRFFKENGRRCAEGKLVTTCATRLPSGKLAGQSMPDDLYKALLNWKSSTSDPSSSTN